MSLSKLCVHFLLIVLYVCSLTNGQQEFGPNCNPNPGPAGGVEQPWDNFDPHVIARTHYGDIRGFSVPWHIEDLYWNPCWQDHPPWFTRRINVFLGIPYARPPIGDLRFKRTKRPQWGRPYWDATYFRPACPQRVEELRRDIPDYPKANISEDCLYMNIFAPNFTNPDGSKLVGSYPVLVFIHKGDFLSGSAQTHPGHKLATQNLVVVTFNYRLGALGFLSLQDPEAPGNFGLHDQFLALEFIKDNIKVFQGDPDRITLAGDLAGAASVGFHLISDMTRGKGYFQQCIMMSASDLSPFAYLNPYWRPRDYALELGERLGCDTKDTYQMMKCMRNNNTNSWQRILEMQELVLPKDGTLGVVWAPTQDGGWFQVNPNSPDVPMLTYAPTDFRNQGLFDQMPCIMGLNSQDGVKRANETLPFLERGMFQQEMENFIHQVLKGKGVQDLYMDRARDAVEFQYTHWPDPSNMTARTQMFINFYTDYESGSALDQVVKVQAQYEPQWFYVFTYKSWNDWVPKWMGVSYSCATDYFFGLPFFNETVLNETGVEAKMHYDYDDRNMSSWMMYMFTNFIREGNPTPNMTRNLTWTQFNYYNLSYLVVDYHSYVWFRYRQEKFGFWNEYFPTIALQDFYFATPTPKGYEYVVATGFLSAVLIVVICVIALLGFLIYYQNEENRLARDYPEEQRLQASRATSHVSLARQDIGEVPETLRVYRPYESSYPHSASTGDLASSRPPKEPRKSDYWSTDEYDEPPPKTGRRQMTGSQHSLASSQSSISGVGAAGRRVQQAPTGTRLPYVSHSIV